MLRELKAVEGSAEAWYFRFSNMQVARTISYLNGEVNLDLDHYDEVVGIELLGTDADELKTLAEIIAERNLSIDKLGFAMANTKR